MTETTGWTGSAEVERLLALTEGETGQAALRTYLSDPDSGVRRAAVEVVARRRPEWEFDALCLALLDAADPVRLTAAEVLRPLEPDFPDQPQLFDFLEQALASPSVPARQIAVRLLRRTSDASVSTFVAATGDAEPDVRCEAVRALADLDAVTAIGDLVDDPSPDVRVAVADALGRLGDERGGLILGRLAIDDDPGVRAAAVAAMARALPSGQSRNELTD